MKIFHFKSKAEREAEKRPKPEEKTYMVAIQWYDTKNITSQLVAGFNMYSARECVKELCKDRVLNRDYGIVNIIEFK